MDFLPLDPSSFAEPLRWVELQAYATVAAVLPLVATLLVTLVCGALFVVLLALGLVFVERGLYSAALFTVLMLLSLGMQAARRRLRRHTVPRHPISLPHIAARAVGAQHVGNKARTLATLATLGARVAPGWVVPAEAFEHMARRNRIDLDDTDSRQLEQRVREARVPRRLLRRLEARLASLPYESYWLRSSFHDEDSPDRAFPGVYESIRWERSEGRAALGRALTGVWASYFGERAIRYRETAPGDAPDPLRRLAVLAQPAIPHDAIGIAASADIRTGFRERHTVDVATPGREWTAVHDLLENVVRPMPGCEPDNALPEPFVRRISRMAAQAEHLLGRPAEIEWGLEGSDLWIYQARALTAIPQVHTFTNSYVADIPRTALTPLSHSFLFGEDPVSDLLGSTLENMGIGRLADDDVRLVDGAPYLRWERFKPYVVGAAEGARSIPASLALLRTLASTILGRHRTASPSIPDPPPPGLDGAALVDRIRQLRTGRLVPLVQRQARVVQVALLLDALMRQLSRESTIPPARVASPLTRMLEERSLDPAKPEDVELFRSTFWYLAEKEAEISSLRVVDHPEAFMLRLGMSSAQPRSAPRASGTPVRGVVRILSRLRERLLQERELLNVEINAVNYEARLLVEAIDAKISETRSDWTLDHTYALRVDELAALLAGSLPEARLDERHAAQVEATQRGTRSTGDQAVLHFDPSGAPVEEASLPELGEDVLSVGIPLGGGVVEGEACVIRPGAWIDPERARGAVVVLPDPSPLWTPVAGMASAVIFARGGPLSHLALWCQEHRVPTVVAARRILEKVVDGQRIRVDADAGVVRRV